MRRIVLFAIVAQFASAEFVRIEAGKTAKASEVNGNFEFLAGRIDSLVRVLRDKDDSLKTFRVRLDSTKLDVESFAKGAVAGFLVAPDGDGYLPRSNKTWLLAGGQGETNGVTVPDLRGVFLRGMELEKTIPLTDPGYKLRDIPQRKVGVFQEDDFKQHIHKLMFEYGTSTVTTAPGGKYNQLTDNRSFGLFGDPFIQPTGGAETRPKNVAVYWYVKVK